jgi:hypothetical protein
MIISLIIAIPGARLYTFNNTSLD